MGWVVLCREEWCFRDGSEPTELARRVRVVGVRVARSCEMRSTSRLIIATVCCLVLTACGSPVGDLAAEACADLSGESFFDANTGLVDYVDQLRRLDPDVSIPAGDEAVQDPAELRESEFWIALDGECPSLVETLEGGPTRSELEEIASGIVDAFRAVEDFEFQVDGGLTYGGLLESWPATSAAAARGVIDFTSSVDRLPVGLPAADRVGLIGFGIAVAEYHDAWSEVHEAVRIYIREDGPELAISETYSAAIEAGMWAKDAEDIALTPGPG